MEFYGSERMDLKYLGESLIVQSLRGNPRTSKRQNSHSKSKNNSNRPACLSPSLAFRSSPPWKYCSAFGLRSKNLRVRSCSDAQSICTRSEPITKGNSNRTDSDAGRSAFLVSLTVGNTNGTEKGAGIRNWEGNCDECGCERRRKRELGLYVKGTQQPVDGGQLKTMALEFTKYRAKDGI